MHGVGLACWAAIGFLNTLTKLKDNRAQHTKTAQFIEGDYVENEVYRPHKRQRFRCNNTHTNDSVAGVIMSFVLHAPGASGPGLDQLPAERLRSARPREQVDGDDQGPAGRSATGGYCHGTRSPGLNRGSLP